MEHEAEVVRKLLDRGIEVIEGSSINHDDYYSVKESAELLGVSTKTIRNRIQQGTLKAVFHSIGKGQSQYLILKSKINTATNTLEVVPLSRSVSLPALTASIRAEFQAENEALRAKIDELIQSQEETNKTLQELITAIQQGEKQKLPWYRKLW